MAGFLPAEILCRKVARVISDVFLNGVLMFVVVVNSEEGTKPKY